MQIKDWNDPFSVVWPGKDCFWQLYLLLAIQWGLVRAVDWESRFTDSVSDRATGSLSDLMQMSVPLCALCNMGLLTLAHVLSVGRLWQHL